MTGGEGPGHPDDPWEVAYSHFQHDPRDDFGHDPGQFDWRGGPDRGDRRQRRRDYRRYYTQWARHQRRGPWDPYNYPRPRPGWWPKDEPWPPVGEFPWRKVRRRFLVRFAAFLIVISAVVVAAPIVVISQVLTAAGISGSSYPGVAIVIGMFIVLAVLGTARSARRFAVPFGNLIEATGKVESGDYSARVFVPRNGMRELRWLTESFNSMAAHLEADERQRRTLLADVSHELRTPLAVLRGELEAMIDGVHPMDEAHLTAAVDQIAMLTKLVEDLRTLALAEGGTLPIHKEQTDLAILAGDVAGSFETLAAAGGVKVSVEMPPDMPLVDVDPLRIQQVIGNLVANALRYAPRESTIAIGGETISGSVRVSVTDHGSGVDPDLLPHIFDRFAKSEDSRGSGLGLAIARRLVEAHGGSIRAECPTDGGTRIAFDLPA